MSHVHAYRVADPPKCVEIDPHVCLQPISGGGEGVSNADGSPVPEYFAGYIVGHDRPGFDWRCEGFVRTAAEGQPRWEMTGTLEGGDLTLSPSILCRLGTADPASECGFHGWVRDGKWVSA